MMTKKPVNALGVDISWLVVMQRQYLATVTRQKQRGRKTRRSSANHNAIEEIVLHVSTIHGSIECVRETGLVPIADCQLPIAD